MRSGYYSSTARRRRRRRTPVAQMHATLLSKTYAQTREQLVADPIVVAMAGELAALIRAGRGSREELFHDDGCPRAELIQRANATYDSRGGPVRRRHLGAVAEAIGLIWTRNHGVQHAQLIEKDTGEWVAVVFPSLEEANAYRDVVEETDAALIFRGCVPVVSAVLNVSRGATCQEPVECSAPEPQDQEER